MMTDDYTYDAEVERQAVEFAAGQRDARQRAARARAERRERIATAVLASLWAATTTNLDVTPSGAAHEACDLADALMAELDARLQADLEAAK